ncbi:MAG TPA: hypothetical protein VJV03_10335 [Pyrinomonadaceae bacterium]|nr:hypothetical protein [Pyrinomonadaceae bacterium]
MKELSGLVRKLELEILKTDRKRLKNHVRRMTDLTTDAERTFRFGNPDLFVTNPAQLRYITDELSEKAQELLPSGRNVLSAAATELLNEIIKLVRDSAPVREKLELQQASADLEAKQIRKSFKDAEDHLEKAIDLVDAGFQQPGADDLSSASKHVTDAVAILETLKTDPSGKKSAGSFDVVITLLEGVAYWIKNPEQIVIPDVTRSDNNVDFVNAALSRPGHHASVPVPQTLLDALGKFCSRDSLQQFAIATSGLVLPLSAWKGARAFFGRPVSPGELISKIENTLRVWVQNVQRPCGRHVNLRSIAEALARFV